MENKNRGFAEPIQYDTSIRIQGNYVENKIIKYTIRIISIAVLAFLFIWGVKAYMDARNRVDTAESLCGQLAARNQLTQDGISRAIRYSCENERIGRRLREENQQLREDNKRFETSLRDAVRELRETNQRLTELQQENTERIDSCTESVDRIGEGLEGLDRLLEEITEKNQN